MAVRTWVVRPDREFVTEEGTVGVVSQEAVVKALVDAAIVLDRAGGTIAVSVARARTGIEGEAVTTAVMVTWKDRTDARRAPEAATPLPEGTLQLPDIPERHGTEVEANGRPVGVNAAGEEVDESDLPEHLRGL